LQAGRLLQTNPLRRPAGMKRMPKFGGPIWKSAPLLRLLLPMIAGITGQYYFRIPLSYCILPAGIGCGLLVIYQLLNPRRKFVYSWLTGTGILLLFISVGSCICYQKNIENDPSWIGKFYREKTPVLVTLQEPLIEKAQSYKTLARARAIVVNGQWKQVSGDLLIYFRKDSLPPPVTYGSQIILYTALQPISNSGNPGSFNYRQYCYFQNIGYQVFLTAADYRLLSATRTSFFDEWMIRARMGLLSALRKNIRDPGALSLAEALLIGYRDDLDKILVQAYSNTGVVHIIAISGMHLAMIYGLLLILFTPFQKIRFIRFIKPVIIIGVLWGFSFIAGAAPSILRSTVMFTFIVWGETFHKQSGIYNNLVASAFTILVFSPFSLWDVGFQLSYAAVVSIVVFSKHIRNWFSFRNKLLKKVWDLLSITLSAQILTLPIILYYFHQFPTLFLFTNLFAVPFSGLVLYEELFLLVVSPLPVIAKMAGAVTGWCIDLMDDFITRVDALPLSAWQNLQLSLPQTILLYGVIAGFAWWLLHQQPKGLILALASLLFFFCIRSFDLIQCDRQQKLIVYNIPHHQAIDIVEGRHFQFAGDSILSEDGFLRKFHLTPSRILHRISPAGTFRYTTFQDQVILSGNKRVILLDRPLVSVVTGKKIPADVIIISKNPRLSIDQLVKIFNCNQYVFDASNPLWKINKWKKDCDSLHLHSYSIPEQGAFEMEL
jgi:competence protein ComEC